MPLGLKNIALAAAFAGMLLAPVSASAMIVCSVSKTPDGFVALREQPNAAAKIVARMRAGDMVHGDPDVRERGNWQYVTWWKQKTFDAHNADFDKRDGKGWVNSRFIGKDDDCG